MGTHHGGNGGDLPPEGDRPPEPELPDLPPEWGEITIPDDPAALADDAEQVRAELAQARAESDPPSRPLRGLEPLIAAPLLIVSLTVVATLLALFVMAWSGPGTAPRSGDAPPADRVDLPPITLSDAAGRPIALTAQTPMALLLVEECACQQLILATTAAAPPGVRVVTVGETPPDLPDGLDPADPVPLRLADPTRVVRATLELGPPTDAATVVLVDGDGRIRHRVLAATSVAQYQSELTNLTG